MGWSQTVSGTVTEFQRKNVRSSKTGFLSPPRINDATQPRFIYVYKDHREIPARAGRWRRTCVKDCKRKKFLMREKLNYRSTLIFLPARNYSHCWYKGRFKKLLLLFSSLDSSIKTRLFRKSFPLCFLILFYCRYLYCKYLYVINL